MIKGIKYTKQYFPNKEIIKTFFSEKLGGIWENDEDYNLQREIRKKFEFDSWSDEGFDGNQRYKFNFSDDLSELRKKEMKKFKEMKKGQRLNYYTPDQYNSQIFIIKAGAEKDLENLCDLEEFLISHKYQEAKE